MPDTAPPTAATDDSRDITEFLGNWAEAIVSNDVDRMARFTTDDWILVDKPGAISRARFHAVVADGSLQHTSMTHDILGITRLGSVAIVRTHGRTAGTYLGQAISADEWTTDILVHGADGWRCVLTQLTPRAIPSEET